MPQKVKNPLLAIAIFIMLQKNWRVKFWVLCHTFQEHLGILKYICDWNLKKDQDRNGLGEFSQVISFTPLYSLLPGASQRQKKMGQKTLMNSKGWHLSQNVTLSFLLVTNIFRLKVRYIDIPLSLIINIQPLWNTVIHLIKWTQEKAYPSSPMYDEIGLARMRFLMRQGK